MLAKEFMLLQFCLIYNYEVLIRDLLLQVLMQHFKVCVCVCVCQHDASHHGHSAVVSQLLERGALVNVPGYFNNTALHEAIATNCPQVTRLLLNQGASVSLK